MDATTTTTFQLAAGQIARPASTRMADAEGGLLGEDGALGERCSR